MESIGVLPPHSLNAERAIIGAPILDNAALWDIRASLQPGDLYSRAHQIIYQKMCDLADEGAIIDGLTLSERLRASGDLEKVGGVEYVLTLAEETVTAQGVPSYLAIIKGAAKRRKIKALGQEMIHWAEEEENPDILTAKAEAAILKMGKEEKTGPELIGDRVDTVEKEIREALDNKRPMGLRTGFPKLDACLGGLKKQDLIVFAARPSVGKTALLIQSAWNLVDEGVPVLLFSLEMSKDSLLRRIACYKAGVSYQGLVTGGLNPLERDRFFSALRGIKEGNYPLYIDDTPALSADQILALGRRFTLRYGVQMVGVDYLQLSANATPGTSVNERAGAVSAAGKSLARMCNVPVVMLSQLSRKTEERSVNGVPGIPMLSDLRDSGQIEQDADQVIFLHRAWLYNPMKYDGDKGSFIIAKNRNGKIGQWDFNWIPDVGCWD